uniref:Uncharacterized protein n=1 Tax=Anguilla anguilla TaxID=7936 RepID=A0A0E9W182_ANGAN
MVNDLKCNSVPRKDIGGFGCIPR